MKSSSFRVWCVWGLAAWLLLAGTIFLLQRKLELGAWALMTMAPAGVLFAAWQTLRAGEERARALRVSWWTVTLAGGALAGLLWQAQWEELPRGAGQAVLVALAAEALGLGLWWRRARKSGRGVSRSWLPDAATALGCLAVLGGAGAWAFDHHTRRMEERALALWASLGRPMPEFEQELQPVTENRALTALLGDLQPLGIADLYKATEYSPASHTLILPPEVLALSTPQGTARADRVELAPESLAFLGERAGRLAGIYQGILGREPAVWAFEPEDGAMLRVPNFLATRLCAQLFCADALRRFSRGDAEGAGHAIKAGLRMSESFREQPLVVSVMIRVAVEALFAQAQVRLPAEEGAWERLATDTEDLREALARAIQSDTLFIARCGRGDFAPNLLSSGSLSRAVLGLTLPRWAERAAWHPMMRLEAARTSWLNAEGLRLITSKATLRSDDLAAATLERLHAEHPSIAAPNFTRAWTRLYGSQLVREQGALIREARAHLQSGLAGEPADRPSHVIPDARWRSTLDRRAQTISLSLENAPRWVAHSEVLASDLYLLPLDGSRAWEFDRIPATRTAATR